MDRSMLIFIGNLLVAVLIIGGCVYSDIEIDRKNLELQRKEDKCQELFLVYREAVTNASVFYDNFYEYKDWYTDYEYNRELKRLRALQDIEVIKYKEYAAIC